MWRRTAEPRPFPPAIRDVLRGVNLDSFFFLFLFLLPAIVQTDQHWSRLNGRPPSDQTRLNRVFVGNEEPGKIP